MPDKNSELNFSVINTIQDIPPEAWDRLFGKGLTEGYGYHKTIEEAGLREFSLHYLTGKRNGNLILIIPFFIMEFSFDTLIQGPLRKLAHKLKRLFTLKVIFLGFPTTEEFYLGFDGSEDLSLILDLALEKFGAFCRQERAKGFLFNNVSLGNKALIEYLTKRNFIRMESLPTTMIKIEANSLEDYIKALSKNMRKDLKRKLKRSSAIAQLRTEVSEDIQDISQEIYNLYMHNFDDADVHFEILTPEFFRNICANMPGVARYFITYDKERTVAFNLCLIRDGLFIDKFIGLDPAVSHQYHLYYTSFCHNIDWCIKNGIRFYQPGTTDYYPKVRLGARLIPLFIYAKAFNPLLDLLIRMTARMIEPKNLDSSLKDIERLERRA